MDSKALVELVVKAHRIVTDKYPPEVLRAFTAEQLFDEIMKVVTGFGEHLNAEQKRVIVEAVQSEISEYEYGPIQVLIEDPSITEVMVNGPHCIYVERDGKLHKHERVFRDNAHLMKIIEKIVNSLGRRIDESSPMVDARLPDGSRVNAIIPPLALDGPTLTIRKFSRLPLTAQMLVDKGTMTPGMLKFLEAAVKAKITMMISGGTGSGKTTTLNALSGFIPESERVITIEDAAELQLQQKHAVRLESRPPNIEGQGVVTIRDLVRNALRMRPDRIIVGEVRDGAALDMLQAMNTGHEGSLSTAHANSPRDALARLETMVLMAGVDLPSKAIREQISSALDLIVHQERLRDGSRRITQISEVQKMEGDVITLQDVFVFEKKGVDHATGDVIGEHVPTGLRPSFMDRLAKEGIDVSSEEIFGSSRWRRM